MNKNWGEYGKPEPQEYAGSPEGVEISLVSHTSLTSGMLEAGRFPSLQS